MESQCVGPWFVLRMIAMQCLVNDYVPAVGCAIVAPLGSRCLGRIRSILFHKTQFRWSACGILVRLTRRCSIGTSSSQGNGRPHHCWKPWDKIRLYGIVAQSRIDDQPVVLSKPSEFSTTKTDAWQKTFVSGACVLEPKFLHFYV